MIEEKTSKLATLLGRFHQILIWTIDVQLLAINGMYIFEIVILHLELYACLILRNTLSSCFNLFYFIYLLLAKACNKSGKSIHENKHSRTLNRGGVSKESQKSYMKTVTFIKKNCKKIYILLSRKYTKTLKIYYRIVYQ